MLPHPRAMSYYWLSHYVKSCAPVHCAEAEREVGYGPADCWMRTGSQCSTNMLSQRRENKATYKPFYPKNVALSFLGLTEAIVSLPGAEPLRRQDSLTSLSKKMTNIWGY